VTNIVVLGASTSWVPRLVTDLLVAFDERLEIRLVDINPSNAALCAEWGEAANKHWGRRDRYVATTDRQEALSGADAVLITISTGGLDAMEHDIAIPERYGIYTPVGDTTGPAGWSRSIRNIPVFQQFAEDFARICPRAFIANYTNPMASLTATLQRCCPNPVVGLCHALTLQRCCPNPVVGLCHAFFETKDVIQHLFGLDDWSQISLSIAGMNHFTWVVDFNIGREDGYALLRGMVGDGSLRDLLPESSADEINIYSRHKFCVELYDAFGYLPYPADRHTCEFVSTVLCGSPERYSVDIDTDVGQKRRAEVIRYCDVRRTSVAERRAGMSRRDRNMRGWIEGTKEMPPPSRETGAKMIRAYLTNQPIVDAVNTLNVGQIPGLPLGACVETLGVVDGLGAQPLMVDRVPEHLLEVMRPQAVCQKWITKGTLEGDRELLLQALYRDPQCAHLKYHEVRKMADELFEANRPYF
jgi:alpha-galactosidase